MSNHCLFISAVVIAVSSVALLITTLVTTSFLVGCLDLSNLEEIIESEPSPSGDWNRENDYSSSGDNSLAGRDISNGNSGDNSNFSLEDSLTENNSFAIVKRNLSSFQQLGIDMKLCLSLGIFRFTISSNRLSETKAIPREWMPPSFRACAGLFLISMIWAGGAVFILLYAFSKGSAFLQSKDQMIRYNGLAMILLLVGGVTSLIGMITVTADASNVLQTGSLRQIYGGSLQFGYTFSLGWFGSGLYIIASLLLAVSRHRLLKD